MLSLGIVLTKILLLHLFQVDRELASGEYFLKEKERQARKQERKKVRVLICGSS